MRLVAPGFGYAVGWRTNQADRTRFVLRVFDGGRWRDATPAALRSPGSDDVEDVSFVNRRDGWIATFNCAMAAVQLFRTTDGGRSWRSLGTKSGHSCSSGATFLSFINSQQGWMEPVSPTGPVGALLKTTDGGTTWKHIATGPAVGPGRSLPCLGPIAFVSRSTGWQARCDEGSSEVFSTTDGGRRWKRAPIAVRNGHLDLPWFHGNDGVEAATESTRPAGRDGLTHAVVFSVTHDGGRSWEKRATRRIPACPLTAYFTDFWPASIGGKEAWWVVAGRDRPTVQVTTDGGRSWRSVVARGLPTRRCSILNVSAAGPTDAWVTALTRKYRTDLFRTSDGGRTWQRVDLFRR